MFNVIGMKLTHSFDFYGPCYILSTLLQKKRGICKYAPEKSPIRNSVPTGHKVISKYLLSFINSQLLFKPLLKELMLYFQDENYLASFVIILYSV